MRPSPNTGASAKASAMLTRKSRKGTESTNQSHIQNRATSGATQTKGPSKTSGSSPEAATAMPVLALRCDQHSHSAANQRRPKKGAAGSRLPTANVPIKANSSSLRGPVGDCIHTQAAQLLSKATNA